MEDRTFSFAIRQLAFAKRPLRLCEIREAISAVRGTLIVLTDDEIINECPILTHRIVPHDQQESPYLVLSHPSSLRSFLHSHRSHRSDKELCRYKDCDVDDVVDPDLLALACVKHLLKRRYVDLIPPDSQSICNNPALLKQHPFATYAAKYWYRHCDKSSRSQDLQALVKKFLLSHNSYTSLQIQSIAVIGHFLISYDPVTDIPRSWKQNLPRMTDDIDDKVCNIKEQYQTMVSDWSHLLHLGLSSDFVGELDRVRWPTLGTGRFLTRWECRYQSLTIGVAPASVAPISKLDTATCRLVAASCYDEKQQALCYMDDSSENNIRLSIQIWSLDGAKALKMHSSYSVVVTKSDSLWSRFSTIGLQRLPLVPKASHASLISPVKLSLNANLLHVGCRMLQLSGPATQRAYSMFDVSSGRPRDCYFEESCQVDSVIVLTRRRMPKTVDTNWDLERTAHAIRMKRIRDANQYGPQPWRRGTSKPYYDSSEESSSDEDGWNVGHDEDLHTYELPEDMVMELKEDSADDVSILDYQSGAESDSTGPDYSDSSSEDIDQQDDSILGNMENDSNAESEDEGELSSLLSDASERPSAWDSLSESSSASADEANQDGKGKRFSYGVRITSDSRGAHGVRCDGCHCQLYESWHYCANCESTGGGFDLCKECIQKGYWCYDQRHDLFECGPRGPQGVISWRTALVRQDLIVLDVAQDPPKELYTWHGSYLDMLHDSAPCIEPRTKLVVWPVGQERLLFAQHDGGSARLHSLRTTNRKARQISVALHFSGCGRYLHAAHIEAVQLTKQTKLMKKGRTGDSPPIYGLIFVLTTLRISTDSAPTRRPEKVARHVYPLGPWKRPIISVLPYSWTWTDTELYLCLSDSTLRVYKVPLTQASSNVDNTANITSPKNVIFLPRSAQTRTVQFFPADKPGATSKVIIGPHYERRPSEPVVLFLKDTDLGKWIDAYQKEDMNDLKYLKKRKMEDFEDFDSSDCDILAFDQEN